MLVAVLSNFARDRVAWIGSVGSTLASIVAGDGFLPKTAEAWAALMLTLCTIAYMLIKIWLLVRSSQRQPEMLPDI